MCAIIGYYGATGKLQDILFSSLLRMEYRGYDSAGISFINHDHHLKIFKRKGKIKNLITEFPSKEENQMKQAYLGIGHTRWASHGSVNDQNAHPIYNKNQSLAIVHNGIIENFMLLKKKLKKKGYQFYTETDTEVLIHLIDYYFEKEKNLDIAFEKSIHQVEGSLGIILISSYAPNMMLAYRSGSSVILGKKNQEFWIASDIHALSQYTNEFIYLDDHEILKIHDHQFSIKNYKKKIFLKKTQEIINLSKNSISKGKYPNFMLKEIYEQAKSIKNCIRGRINLKDGTIILSAITNLKTYYPPIHRIIILGMGSSYFAGMIGRYLIEEISHIPTNIEYASEFRYHSPIINKNSLVIIISQSGETADSLAALKEAKLKGAITLSITNTIGSSIARESHEGIFLYAGPEIAVASTKSFTSSIIALYLIALSFARNEYISFEQGIKNIYDVIKLPKKTNLFLKYLKEIQSAKIHEIAKKFSHFKNIFFLGRSYNYPIALEAALKVKEVAYIHAEGYNASEMKHGPIALIDKHILCIFIIPHDFLFNKMISSIQEMRSRGAKIIAITNKKNKFLKNITDAILYIPKSSAQLSPIFSGILIQIFAYELALLKNLDIDQPKNLAKSVTVE